MCRSAEGAALVLHAMAGPDDRDFSVPDIPVNWDAGMDVTEIRLGYLAYAFEAEEDAEYRAHHARILDLLRTGWGDLRPVELPASNLNFFVEYVERAAGFTEFLRSGLETQLVRPRHGMELRAHHLVPTVEYLQANRARQRLMEETHQALSEVDVVLAPHGVWWHPRRSLNALTSLTVDIGVGFLTVHVLTWAASEFVAAGDKPDVRLRGSSSKTNVSGKTDLSAAFQMSLENVRRKAGRNVHLVMRIPAIPELIDCRFNSALTTDVYCIGDRNPEIGVYSVRVPFKEDLVVYEPPVIVGNLMLRWSVLPPVSGPFPRRIPISYDVCTLDNVSHGELTLVRESDACS